MVVGYVQDSKVDPVTVSSDSVLTGYSSILMIRRCVYSLIFYNEIHLDYLLRTKKVR